MRLVVIIPFGPGHDEIVHRATGSVKKADRFSRGDFKSVDILTVDDSKGMMGRSAARNYGIALAKDADWIFLLDADDTMEENAFTVPIPKREAALIGPAYVLYWPRHRERKPHRHLSAAPSNWGDLMKQGPVQSYMMGNFYRGDALRAHPFREDLDHGEDWEFHLSFLAKHDWRMSPIPLAMADTTFPSATGPRGGATRWGKVCEPFFAYWRKRGRIPLTDEERREDYWL